MHLELCTAAPALPGQSDSSAAKRGAPFPAFSPQLQTSEGAGGLPRKVLQRTLGEIELKRMAWVSFHIQESCRTSGTSHADHWLNAAHLPGVFQKEKSLPESWTDDETQLMKIQRRHKWLCGWNLPQASENYDHLLPYTPCIYRTEAQREIPSFLAVNPQGEQNSQYRKVPLDLSVPLVFLLHKLWKLEI